MIYALVLGRQNNFEKAKKQETDAQGVAYDYHSIMHYSENAFSRNGQPTIVPKVNLYPSFKPS